ncbi:DUF6134 family protein [Draconibacterium orientale]|uniref:DUF6134 family protein n=1 Tax=Draconibacterium orientale TaxID=1168034 RepID=UPI0029BFF9C3|nr:DUF6134 family protein [Draconibacterium orientale]
MEINLNTIEKSHLTNIELLWYRCSGRIKPNKHENNGLSLFLCLILGILLFIPVSAKPNDLTSRYTMHLLGAYIGEFSVRQTGKNGNFKIEAITDVKIDLLFSYRIKYIQNTVYEQGILQSSHVETYKNGKLNSTVLLKREGASYLLVSNGDTTIMNDTITYSGSLIYFNEPRGIKNIYKERSAEMQQINSVSEHTYAIKDENEKELNSYFYEGGILQYAQMKHATGTIKLKRITTSDIND